MRTSALKIRYEMVKTRLLPYRSACISVIIGIFAIVLVSVISAVGESIIESELDNLGMNSIMLGLEDKEALTLDQTIYTQLKSIDGIDHSSPVVLDTGSYRFGEGQESDAFFWGVSAQAPEIVALNVIHGRMFTASEISNAAKVCLVDETIAKAAYQRSNIVGKKIVLYVNGVAQSYDVIGVIHAQSNLLSAVTGNFLPNFIYMPYTTLSCFSAKNGYDEIMFQTTPQASVDAMKEEINAVFQPLVMPGQKTSDYIRVTDLCSQRSSISSLMASASVVMALIASVALLVSGVSMMNAVSNAVQLKRREIGIRKSLGASIALILREFIKDVMLGTALSLFVGILIGTGILLILLWILGLPVCCNLNLILFGIISMLLIAFCFSFFPALHAARMSPADALRSD